MYTLGDLGAAIIETMRYFWAKVCFKSSSACEVYYRSLENITSFQLAAIGSPRMTILLTDSASVFKGSGPFEGPFGGPFKGSPEPDSSSFSGPFVKSAAMRAVVFFELYGFVSCLGSIGPSANIKVEEKVKNELQTILRW